MATAIFTGWYAVTANDAETRQPRAYLGVKFGSAGDNSRIFDFIPGGVRFFYVIKNYGITPARHVKHKVKINVTETYKSELFEISDKEIDSPGTDTILPPQDIISSSKTERMGESDLAIAQNAADKRLYVVGIVRYEDVFGHVRHLHFCGYWLGSALGPLAMHSFPNCPGGE